MYKRIAEIDRRLVALLEKGCDKNSLLFEAAHYLLLAPGKRIRPLIVLYMTELFGGDLDEALTVGSALEMVHTYSLIHDDLPCMDNDDMRRGKPTMHRVYGEATAILVGDFLLTYAFEILSHHTRLTPEQKVALITALAEAAGGRGMVAGQLLDIHQDRHADIEKLHSLKTAALFKAAFAFGTILSHKNSSKIALISEWGHRFGLFFQLMDDLKDHDHPEGSLTAQKKAEEIKNSLYLEANKHSFDCAPLFSLI